MASYAPINALAWTVTNTTTGDYTWTQWVANTATATTISYEQATAWEQWRVADYVDRRTRGWLTAEEQDALQREREEQNRERLRRQQELRERMAEARVKAVALLEEVVDPVDWVLDNLIQVEASDGNVYRIELHRQTVHGNIVRIDEHGCVLGRACVAPGMYDGIKPLPTEDGWVGQYLGLKFDAEEFLSHANWSEQYRGCQQVAA
jgi:hypothetical protein